MRTARFLALIALVFFGILQSHGQDAYDKALESFSRIAAENSLGSGRDLQRDVDYIRNFKLEIPETERLRMAKKKLEKMRTERFGVRVEKSGTNKRQSSTSSIGKPKSGVKWNNSGGGQVRPYQQSKAAIERDAERTAKAIQGAQEQHKGTEAAHNEAQADIAASEEMANSFNSLAYAAPKGAGRVDDPNYVESKGNEALKDLNLMTGLDEEEEVEEEVLPKNYDINELLERFERNPYLLDCDELDYILAYLDQKIDEKLTAEKIKNNENPKENEEY